MAGQIYNIAQGLQAIIDLMPDNTQRLITEEVMRNQNSNLWLSALNRIDDELLLNLRDYNDREYKTGEACLYNDGSAVGVYRANTDVNGGVFNPADWDLVAGGQIFDDNAIHTNIDAEISTITEQPDPTGLDILVSEKYPFWGKERVTRRDIRRARANITITAQNELFIQPTSEQVYISAQETDLQITSTNSTPPFVWKDGEQLTIRINDNGTQQNIIWDPNWFEGIGVDLPTKTIVGQTIYVESYWNEQISKHCVVTSTSNGGAENGIKKEDGKYKLGDELTEDTTILGKGKGLNLGTYTDPIGYHELMTGKGMYVANAAQPGVGGFSNYTSWYSLSNDPIVTKAYFDIQSGFAGTPGQQGDLFGIPVMPHDGQIIFVANAMDGTQSYFLVDEEKLMLFHDGGISLKMFTKAGGSKEGTFYEDSKFGVGFNYNDRAVDEANIDWNTDNNHVPSIGMIKENSNSGGSLIMAATPPVDTSKLWFNTSDNIIYFYDGSDWLSSSLEEIVFNEQGTTPNNTWFRCGNTVTGETGIGYNIGYDVKIVDLSFNRSPTTAQSGNFWLYSNESTGTDNAAVVCTFAVGSDARGVLNPSAPTTISNGKYVSMRWNGNQTNNNVCVLRFRKKYV